MPKPQPVKVPGKPDSGLPISSAMIIGNLVFVSGHVGRAPGEKAAPAGIESQTVQTLENLRAVLTAAGTDFEHVVKTNVYLVNTADFAAMNRVYRRYFPNHPPARTTVGVALAGDDLLIEIEMVAALPG